MTRVLITGAGGFVGSHILESVLTRTDWEAVCIESFRHNGVVDRARAAIGEHRNRVDIITHDLTVPLSYVQLRRIGKIDYLVNVASRCHVGESIEDPVGFVKNNISLILEALELARVKEPSKFVQISTDEVYGSHIISSMTDHRPSSPYSASKAAQEDLCMAYQRSYGVPLTIVNSCNMFGERQSNLAFIPRVVRALRKGLYVQIHMDNGKPGKRNYTYVRNVADHIVDSLSFGEIANGTDRISVPGQREIDNFTLFLQIADTLGYTDPQYSLIDASEERRGYDSMYHGFGGPKLSGMKFEAALTRTIKWFNQNPDWLE